MTMVREKMTKYCHTENHVLKVVIYVSINTNYVVL